MGGPGTVTKNATVIEPFKALSGVKIKHLKANDSRTQLCNRITRPERVGCPIDINGPTDVFRRRT